MLPVRHEMIMASAGAGKTYALVSRYVNLLLHGQPPEHLVALTFSRKAAGEFFDKIFERLACAVTDEKQRAELEKELAATDDGGIPVEALTAALRSMADAMPRLRLGTLDSLFVQILQTFYLEFGFSSGFSLLSDAQIDEARRQACEAVFSSSLDADSGQGFLEAFRSATYGAEEKSILSQLMGFVAEHYSDFLSGADQAK
ncbi:MAG: ATP-dependent helicase/nuclease subunit A [Verrucomicrobiales bacterium]|jgi:ATP-dependent helicase/nuclease subunit A